MVTVLVPLPVIVTPGAAMAINVPLLTVMVVVKGTPAPSTSLTVILLLLAAENTCGVSSTVVWVAAGTLLTGASATGVTLKARVEVSKPPRPSLTV